jgi:hypothetical protein
MKARWLVLAVLASTVTGTRGAFVRATEKRFRNTHLLVRTETGAVKPPARLTHKVRSTRALLHATHYILLACMCPGIPAPRKRVAS